MGRILLGIVVGLLAISASATEPNVPVKGLAQPPTYVDVNGRVLGPLFGDYDVLLRLDQFSIVVTMSGGTWYQETPVIFAEPGCSGTAYSYSEPSPEVTRGIVAAGPLEGQFTLYVLGDRGEVVTTSSFLWDGACSDYPPVQEMAWPVIRTYELTYMFQPPFRIR